MNYELEDLVPIVAKLAESYTSKESTSISYDKAQQLMEAVLYCIREGEREGQFLLAPKDKLSAERMYAFGVKCVEEKTKEALNMYNRLLNHFSGYGNECLNDTVLKGLPEFFKWYNCKYEPQNTILTLDYPVLNDSSAHTGIDRIYDFIICIDLEQKFLNSFSPEYVVEILSVYNKQYKLMIENICEIVLLNVIGHILAEKKISSPGFEPEEYLKLQALIQKKSPGELRAELKEVIKKLTLEYYENDEKLTEYLYQAVDNISVRLKCAAENETLRYIL